MCPKATSVHGELASNRISFRALPPDLQDHQELRRPPNLGVSGTPLGLPEESASGWLLGTPAHTGTRLWVLGCPTPNARPQPCCPPALAH